MARFVGFGLSLLLLAILTPLSGCGENPCHTEWLMKCECCENSGQTTACRSFMQRTIIKDLPYSISDEQAQGCKLKVADFKCENEAALNLRSWCNPTE